MPLEYSTRHLKSQDGGMLCVYILNSGNRIRNLKLAVDSAGRRGIGIAFDISPCLKAGVLRRFFNNFDEGKPKETFHPHLISYIDIIVDISNIGKNMQITIVPITTPKNTIISGSIMLVRPLIAASTSAS